MAKKISTPRRDLLARLYAQGGSLAAERLSVPARRLASRMQRDGLVAWKAVEISSPHTCLEQTLFITNAGRVALAAAMSNI